MKNYQFMIICKKNKKRKGLRRRQRGRKKLEE
jgi:hypothetical protein